MTSRQDGTVLYRLYAADGTLLYVGITDRLIQRFADHRHHSRWWPEVAGKAVTRYAARAEAEGAERAAIRDEDPVHNILGTPRHGEAIAAARKRSPALARKRAVARDDELRDLFGGEPLLFGGEPEWLRDHYRRLIERRLAERLAG